MNREIVAMCLQWGGQFITALIKNRSPKQPEPRVSAVDLEEYPWIEDNKVKESIEAGCIPCAIGHVGTCSGVLNEAMRFAKKDGMNHHEVIDRVNMCLDELNAMERIDLRPELTVNLSPWEKELADKALVASRSIRHGLEGLSSVADLERMAAITQSTRQEVGRAWFKNRLANMSPEEKKKIAEKAMEKLEEE